MLNALILSSLFTDFMSTAWVISSYFIEKWYNPNFFEFDYLIY